MNTIPSDKHLQEIWEQVPPNYYQKGVAKNSLQRLWHTNKLSNVVSAIKKENSNPKTILDVGCASGWFLSNIKKNFPKCKCVGIDVYQDAIDYGKKKYKNITLSHADGHKLPLKPNSLDVVICCEVLEHVVSADKVLQEIKRVLKPGGIAIIEIDSGNWLFKLVWFWWTTIRNGVWKDSHLHPFSIKTLEDLFVRNKFTIKEKKIFNLTMAVVFTLVPKKRKS